MFLNCSVNSTLISFSNLMGLKPNKKASARRVVDLPVLFLPSKVNRLPIFETLILSGFLLSMKCAEKLMLNLSETIILMIFHRF